MAEQQYRAGDIVTVEYNNGTQITGELVYMRGTANNDLGFAFGATSFGTGPDEQYVADLEGHVHRYVSSIRLVTPFAPEEPPLGTTVSCDGCGALHFRTKDGWASADGGAPTTWWHLMREADGCGIHRVVYMGPHA